MPSCPKCNGKLKKTNHPIESAVLSLPLLGDVIKIVGGAYHASQDLHRGASDQARCQQCQAYAFVCGDCGEANSLSGRGVHYATVTCAKCGSATSLRTA